MINALLARTAPMPQAVASQVVSAARRRRPNPRFGGDGHDAGRDPGDATAAGCDASLTRAGRLRRALPGGARRHHARRTRRRAVGERAGRGRRWQHRRDRERGRAHHARDDAAVTESTAVVTVPPTEPPAPTAPPVDELVPGFPVPADLETFLAQLQNDPSVIGRQRNGRPARARAGARREVRTQAGRPGPRADRPRSTNGPTRARSTPPSPTTSSCSSSRSPATAPAATATATATTEPRELSASKRGPRHLKQTERGVRGGR